MFRKVCWTPQPLQFTLYCNILVTAGVLAVAGGGLPQVRVEGLRGAASPPPRQPHPLPLPRQARHPQGAGNHPTHNHQPTENTKIFFSESDFFAHCTFPPVQVLSLRKSLRELVGGIPHLESLNLSGCYNLSDSALDTAFNRDLPSLKVLNLSLCKEVTDNSLGRISQYCKNLEVLELGGCTKITNTGLLLVSWGLRKIRSLNLRSCWQVSDQGIANLAGFGMNGEPGSAGARTLASLSLQDCQKLTDESLKHISEGLPAIRDINLSFCVSVTDTGLKSLARIPGLQRLNLRSCDNISDIGVGFLAEGGPASQLATLDVSFCDRVTDSALAHVSAGLPALTALSLSSCQITDLGIARVAKDLCSLHTLNIGQCVKLTDKSLDIIANQIHSLRSIDLYGCTKISAEGVKALNKCENLKVVNLGLWHPF